jgi:hypothetical protein
MRCSVNGLRVMSSKVLLCPLKTYLWISRDAYADRLQRSELFTFASLRGLYLDLRRLSPKFPVHICQLYVLKIRIGAMDV